MNNRIAPQTLFETNFSNSSTGHFSSRTIRQIASKPTANDTTMLDSAKKLPLLS
jgi:hypothetical protein